MTEKALEAMRGRYAVALAEAQLAAFKLLSALDRVEAGIADGSKNWGGVAVPRDIERYTKEAQAIAEQYEKTVLD